MTFTLLRAAVAASAALLQVSVFFARAEAVASPVAESTMTDEGCYSSYAPLVFNNTYIFQSYGWCQQNCTQLNMPVMATTKGSDCYCGTLLPALDTKTSASNCNSPCNGYGTDTCGGQGFWSVRLTGLQSNVGNYDTSSGSSSSSTSSPTSTPFSTEQTSSFSTTSPTTTQSPSVVTEAGQTVIITASSIPSSTAAASGGSSNRTAIAAGVVVGVVVIAAIIGGSTFLIRSRRRKAVEEDYRRNAAISRFVAGHPQKTEGSTNDARLDPSMLEDRRMSDGSIADERDFSRRILQVRNPDGV